MRKTVNINEGWEFFKGADKEAAVWERVQLPHTWNALDGQDGGGDYYQGAAWYRRTLSLDALPAQTFIRFGAVSKKAEVWCNGMPVGEHSGGFSAFTFELSRYLRLGENELLVRADNSNSLPIYPHSADFTFFGGIYRDAELICFDSTAHLDLAFCGTDAVFISPENDGKIKIEAAVTEECVLSAAIFDAEGKKLAYTESAVGAGMAALELRIAEPHLWHGTDAPYLYSALVCVSKNAEQDRAEISFGFRAFEVTADKGFFLNGSSYPLHGVCRHQDRENLGWALTDKEHIEDMEIIREIGANTVRLAHYQQSPFFYELCDRSGTVVWAEIPFISVYDNCPEGDENLRTQLRELILQNYNHPSICFWGIANEVGIGGESEALYEILRELNDLAKKLDPTRLTTIANVGMTKTSSPLFHITDVTSYNEYMGWYEGTADDHGSFCDTRHGEIPEIPMAISEYGADSVLSWHSPAPKCKDYTEEYQAIVHEKAEQAFSERPYIWATWLWNMFDFAADNRNEGGCKGRNNKGLVSFDRKVKKQAFYYYKARWSREPFVYICGKRFTKQPGPEITVKIYSNCSEVSLTVNGADTFTRSGEAVFSFRGVMLRPGKNLLTAKTPEGCSDELVIECVDELPKEYTLVVKKDVSDTVTQWFASLQTEKVTELKVNAGCLSVFDPLEEVYRYPEGFKAVQEIIAKPMSVDNPAMAARLDKGGAMSFKSIWNHINRLLPDEAIYILNERLNKIQK